MATMQERFKGDMLGSLERIQKLYRKFNDAVVGTNAEETFCMKFTTVNDWIFSGFYSGNIGSASNSSGLIGDPKKYGSYVCIKLSFNRNSVYYSAYVYLIATRNHHNYYLNPESDPYNPAYGIVFVDPFNGKLTHRLVNDVDSTVAEFFAFFKVK